MILFTGKGTSGSWKIRGEQLGGQIGLVKPRATLEDCRRADLIVLVKRPSPGLMDAIRASKTPWVWDVVDFYPQPQCTEWVKSKAVNWVKGQLARHRPGGIIWPNQRMADDVKTRIKGRVIYHHYRPSLKVNQIRKDVQVVGYEGSKKYLGGWRSVIEDECEKRGWQFRINCPVDEMDICVAFRDDPFNGYAQYHWKSNVKLSNCHGSGTPFIGAAEYGYVETAAGGEVWTESKSGLASAFDSLARQEARLDIRDGFLRNAYSLDMAARDLKVFLDELI